MSKIEWTERTWNPIVGCSIVSPGCTNCYAMKMAARIEKMNRTGGSGSNYVNHYDGTTKCANGNVVWTGKLARAPEKTLLAPLSRKQPTKYFVNSMGDLFHEDCPDEWIDRVFAVMALCPQHTFQVLTKRAERMRDYLTKSITPNMIGECAREIQPGVPLCLAPWPLPNVWLGVSCERQQEADERIPLLLQTPAAVRFISAEPLLGPIDLRDRLKFWHEIACDQGENQHRKLVPNARLDWVIAGGESGPKASPMHPDWARKICDDCAAWGVPFFFKQWGAWQDGGDFKSDAHVVLTDGRHFDQARSMNDIDREVDGVMKFNPTMMRRVGKKAAGRLLDGREHNDYPQVRG